ncbi:MAG TPA: response regulator [Flavitalea sp.]|nr:response regulator [Flavitalea sp.]
MKKHILLIESSQEGYSNFIKVLTYVRVDCKVTYANNCKHALEMLKFLEPDCIFMRIDVNEEETIEWVKQIRNHTSTGNSKLIVYDDEVTGSMIRRSISQGADYCIDRPCTFSDVNILLKDVFN